MTEIRKFDSVDSSANLKFAANDSASDARKDVTDFHRKNTVCWQVGENVESLDYTFVTRLHPSKANGNTDTFLIGRVSIAREDGKRAVKSSGLPVIKNPVFNGNKASVTPLTRALKPVRSFVMSDLKLAGKITSKAFKLAADNGWGYDESRNISADVIERAIEIELD
jgi:hypothetical protein